MLFNVDFFWVTKQSMEWILQGLSSTHSTILFIFIYLSLKSVILQGEKLLGSDKYALNVAF